MARHSASETLGVVWRRSARVCHGTPSTNATPSSVDAMFGAVRSNHQLVDVRYWSHYYGFGTTSTDETQRLDALLSFNRFRHDVIPRIQPCVDLAERGKWFATALVQNSVRQPNASRVQLLLRSNVDLLLRLQNERLEHLSRKRKSIGTQ